MKQRELKSLLGNLYRLFIIKFSTFIITIFNEISNHNDINDNQRS